MRFLIIIFIIILSCSQHKSIGPNYNQGRSHNESVSKREGIVMKQDKFSKKQMSKTRKRASRAKKIKKTHRKQHKYIR